MGRPGLSAAFVLGRRRRNVLICDDGHTRNAASHATHCLLGNEGIAPAELLAKARHELRAYGLGKFRVSSDAQCAVQKDLGNKYRMTERQAQLG